MPWFSRLDNDEAYDLIRNAQRSRKTRQEIIAILSARGIKISLRGLDYFIAGRVHGKSKRAPMVLPARSQTPSESAPISFPAPIAPVPTQTKTKFNLDM
jgi:hypothetical protein